MSPPSVDPDFDIRVASATPMSHSCRTSPRLDASGGIAHDCIGPGKDHGMKPSIALATHRETIRRVVEANRATNPRVFGSVLRGEDAESSDLDILVDPASDMSLFDLGAIHYELNRLLGVPVDIVTPAALPARVRERVLAEARRV
jgi:predicted nucleotidyltransferase